MAYPGPPGVNSAHPSLPPRPPPAPLPLRNPAAPGTSGSRFSSTFASAGAAGASNAPAPSPSYPVAPGLSREAPAPTPTTTSYSAAPALTHYDAPPATYASYPPSQRQHHLPGPLRHSAGAGAPHGGGYHRGGPHNQNSNRTTPYTSGHSSGDSQAYGPTLYPSGAPLIRNPFPAPVSQHPAVVAGPTAANDDAEMAAQIAQWQSAYMPRDARADAGMAGLRGAGRIGPIGPEVLGFGASASDAAQAAATALAVAAATTTRVSATTAPGDTEEQAAERHKTVYRSGGGKKWADDTLTEWDPAHLRLFVGNLAGETTDESLLKAFSRWKSVQKSKVIRDKRTNKSKGFGFVSFSDPDDFFQAAKEMNGKYIQSHPVTVKKSTTEIKVRTVKDDKRSARIDKRGKASGGGSGGGAGSAFEPRLGPVPGGIVKPGQKTKGGLKLLG